MRKAIIAVFVLALLGVILLLHLCPSLESWLHQLTGWY